MYYLLNAVLICSLVSATAHTAHAQVYRFNCFQHATYEYQHTGDTAWIDTSYSVTVDFEKKKVTLKNKGSMYFDITGYDPLRPEKNGNTIILNATDRKGAVCNLELTLFHQVSFHVATLVVRYPHIIFAYRLRKAGDKRRAYIHLNKDGLSVHLPRFPYVDTNFKCGTVGAQFFVTDSYPVAGGS